MLLVADQKRRYVNEEDHVHHRGDSNRHQQHFEGTTSSHSRHHSSAATVQHTHASQALYQQRRPSPGVARWRPEKYQKQHYGQLIILNDYG